MNHPQETSHVVDSVANMTPLASNPSGMNSEQQHASPADETTQQQPVDNANANGIKHNQATEEAVEDPHIPHADTPAYEDLKDASPAKQLEQVVPESVETHAEASMNEEGNSSAQSDVKDNDLPSTNNNNATGEMQTPIENTKQSTVLFYIMRSPSKSDYPSSNHEPIPIKNSTRKNTLEKTKSKSQPHNSTTKASTKVQPAQSTKTSTSGASGTDKSKLEESKPQDHIIHVHYNGKTYMTKATGDTTHIYIEDPAPSHHDYVEPYEEYRYVPSRYQVPSSYLDSHLFVPSNWRRPISHARPIFSSYLHRGFW